MFVCFGMRMSMSCWKRGRDSVFMCLCVCVCVCVCLCICTCFSLRRESVIVWCFVCEKNDGLQQFCCLCRRLVFSNDGWSWHWWSLTCCCCCCCWRCCCCCCWCRRCCCCWCCCYCYCGVDLLWLLPLLSSRKWFSPINKLLLLLLNSLQSLRRW